MWFWLILGAAVLGAVEAIINKRILGKVNAIVFTWSLFALSLPVLGWLAFKNGFPVVNKAFILGTFAAGSAFVVAKTISNHAIREGTLSKLTPLISLTVLFTYIISLVFLGEKISGGGVLGLLLVISGVYILNADSAKEDLLKPFKLLFSDKLNLLFVVAAFLVSLETIFMKTAIGNTNPVNVPLVMFAEQCIMTSLLTLYLFKNKKGWIIEVQTNFWKLFLNSMFYLVISLIFFNVITTTAIALAQGVKRSQLLFTLILGIIFLNDRPTKHTWIASLLIILGAVLIKTFT